MADKLLTDNKTSVGSHCFYVVSPSYTVADFPGMSYVACIYDKQWWVRIVLNVDWASNDIKITFMLVCHPLNLFFWPNKDDVCWMPPSFMILKLNLPAASSGRSYKMNTKELNNVAIPLN